MQTRRSPRLVAGALVLALPLLGSCGFGKATDRPNTQAAGINAAGTVVGIYRDADNLLRGFTFNEGIFTSLDAPGAIATIPFGINDAGTIAGSFRDAGNSEHGFLLTRGTFSQIDVPGARSTRLTHIPNQGRYAGFFVDSLNETHGVTGR